MTQPDASERLKTLLSILIALTAVTAAVVAWQASRIGLQAGSADGKALTAAMDEAANGLVQAAMVYANRTGVREYALHRENAKFLKEELHADPDIPFSWWEEMQSELIRAKASHSLLAPDYLINRNGHPAFDEERYRSRARAEAAALKAIDPAPFVLEAAAHRRTASRLVELSLLFTLAIFLFTVALKSEARRKKAWAAAGGALYLAASLMAVIRIWIRG